MEKILEFLKAIFLHKRMKSFYWRALDMGVVELAAVSQSVLTDWHAPLWLVGLLGLGLGEVTKHLNKK